jgi:hypothetical protein
MAMLVGAWLCRVPLPPESDALLWLRRAMRDVALRVLSSREPLTAESGTMLVSAMAAAASCGEPVADIAVALKARREEAATWCARDAMRVLAVRMSRYRTNDAVRGPRIDEARIAMAFRERDCSTQWAPPGRAAHEHAGHPDFIAVVRVDGPSPEHSEVHALVYTDGHVAVTIHEHCYFMWTLPDGRPCGGSIQSADERLAPASVAATLMLHAGRKVSQ